MQDGADDIKRYIPRDNDFYRKRYSLILYILMSVIVFAIIAVGIVFYQTLNRPLPIFNAIQPDGQTMLLRPYDEPNFLPDTIIRFASKGAILAYTFDFVNYNKQVASARPYFTNDGWNDYLRSVNTLIQNIVQNQLFVNGVVSGQPVISNQGPLPNRGYTWRVQIPFLVTYQSANMTTKRSFYAIVTVVKVPTSTNPQRIGIDQFVMV